MRQKHIRQRDILFLSISMFIIVLVWVLSNIYHAWVTTTITEDLQLQIVPIAPTFDVQTLNLLKTRQQIEPIFELNNITASNPASESAEEIPIEEEPVEEEPIEIETETPVEDLPVGESVPEDAEPTE